MTTKLGSPDPTVTAGQNVVSQCPTFGGEAQKTFRAASRRADAIERRNAANPQFVCQVCGRGLDCGSHARCESA